MPTTFIDPLSDERWLKFVSANKRANIFHHPAWLRVLHRQYRFRVFAVCAEDGDKEVVAGMPFCEVRGLKGRTRWVSLPFSDHCPPLSADGYHLDPMAEFLLRQSSSSGVSSIEVRCDMLSGTGFSKRSDSVLHTTALNCSTDQLFHSFKKTQVQQPITKSLKDGLKAEVTDGFSAFERFYDLHLSTRRRLGVPVQPKSFFHILYDEIIRPGLGFVVLVKSGERSIAAGIFGGYSRTLTYKYGASDEIYLGLRPNNLLLWTAMQEGVKRGFSIFDFGKTDLENEGLRKFKSGWGSVESPLYYSYYPEVPAPGPLDVINRRLVGPILRNSPKFVTRLTGELFYRFTA